MTISRTVRALLMLHGLIVFLLFFSANLLSAQNLIDNGNFEMGNGVGFSSLYSFIPAPTGTTNPGQYAVGTNPQPFNTASFISMGDRTTGTGNMLIVDGTNNSGNPEPVFWRIGPNGEICGLTVGQAYTFRYWVRTIYQAGIPGSSVADVRVRWNNVQGQGGNGWSLAPTSGSTLAPAPGAAWTQVAYTIIPTNACVRIEMFNLNGSFAGNDFAIDDIELLPPLQPLALTHSVTQVTCFGANNGAIVGYGTGGVTPYQAYALSGPVSAISTTGVFTNLPPGTYSLAVFDAATPVANTVTVSNIVITQPPNLTVSPLTASICPGDNITLTANGPPVSNWAASPTDPSLTTPTAQSITVAPVQSTTYTVTSTQTQNLNLISNGDFSAGNQGFFSDYQFQNPTNPNGGQRAYGIVSNAAAWWTTFTPCVARGGSGNMMVVDGSTFNGGNDRVWCQTVPVQPGSVYNFTYWIQSLTATNLANIVVTINGVTISAIDPAPVSLCSWQQRNYSWGSGAATTATICIFNRTTTAAGNDFALDDISFTTPNTCTLTAQATVTVSGTAAVTGFTFPTPVCAGTANLLPALEAGFITGGVFSATPAGLNINPSNGEINVATSTPGTYNITYTVPSSGCNAGGTFTYAFTLTNAIQPVTGFSYGSPVCINGTNPTPNAVPGFTTGGSFSSTVGLSVNAATGEINLAASLPGTYTVTYLVPASNCNPAASSTAGITLTSVLVPVTGFSYTTPVCANSTNPVPVTAPGFTAGGVYSAAAGLSINPATGVINLSASTPGTYTVLYNVAAAGCNPAGSSAAIITINPSVTPVTGFSYASPVCTNDADLAPAVVSGFVPGGSFSSTSGLVLNPTNGLISVAASTPGTYTVTYTVTASGCNPASSSSAVITINAAAVPVTTFNYNTPVCMNGTNPVPLPAAGFVTGGIFSSTAGLTINSATGVIDLSTSLPGTYTVTYTVPAANCRLAGNTTATITLQALPAPPVVQSPILYCQSAATVPITATGSALRWYSTATGGTGSATAPRPVSTTAGTQSFFVSQTVNGCEGNRALVEVIIHPLPVANAGPDKQVRAGQSVQLDGSASGNGITILWTPQQFITGPSSSTPIVSPPNDITYTMNVTSGNGCVARDEVRVTVLQDLIIPNVFSPNSDNINDRWIIKFIEQYPNNRVQIFNRYGQLLFETRGYSSSNAWDGTHNGKALPVGAYFYIIRAQEGQEPLRGSISIIR